ncbi:chromosome 14 open reading frame 119 [Elysia marginata]|uniref:Chromosome 14 open reading frame 119 n=1 Tax=Elysia marginata TaxID=1093978 RepID=A0AAV4JPX4_9GAST|nr:chromosome 14 open reading frame 119 [Elysia marginata]
MALSNSEREIQCVTHWFKSWSPFQKQDFLKDLLDKLVPNNLDTLFDSMKGLGVSDRPPSIFQCQLKLFSEWFGEWNDAERNDFLLRLRGLDSEFVKTFEEEAQKLTSVTPT